MVRSSFDAYYVSVWINRISIRYPIGPVCDDDAMGKRVMSTYDLRDYLAKLMEQKKIDIMTTEIVVEYVLVIKSNERRADDNDIYTIAH